MIRWLAKVCQVVEAKRRPAVVVQRGELGGAPERASSKTSLPLSVEAGCCPEQGRVLRGRSRPCMPWSLPGLHRPPVVAAPRLSPESERSVVGRLSNAVGPRAVLRAGRAAAAG